MDHLTAQAPSRPAGAKWHRVWLDAYPCDVPSSIPYPQMPVSGLLDMAVRRYPDRPACTIYNKAFTYREMTEQARHLARSLAALGAGPGRCVGMLLPNMPEYVTALQATWLTGAAALQLSPLMVAEEIAKWLETTGCRILVTLDLLAPPVLAALGRGPLEHVVVASLAEHMHS